MSEKQKKALDAPGKAVAKPTDAKKEGKEGGTSMNTETTKITAVEVMTTGAEIVKMSANEQLVAYGYLMGLLDRSSALNACRTEEAS